MLGAFTESAQAERDRINVNETWEVTYWCEELNCTEWQLRDAVRQVGSRADRVRSSLGKQ